MSNPRIKRQFAGAAADPAQRQITSFFSSRTGDSHDTATSHSEAQAPRKPLLPSSVQANLLSVGMRIRKSVPEGYRTSGPSAFKLWTDNSTTATTNTASTAAATAAASNVPQRSVIRAPTSELLPFCGINKVGGLATQPVFARDMYPDQDDYYSDEQLLDHDAVPELTLSQESVDSLVSEPSRKRVYTDMELHEAPTMPQSLGGWDDEVSPRSFAPSEWGSSRVMAVPKPRVRQGVWVKGMDRENTVGDEDFEEASFLVPGQEMLDPMSA
ncbi:hypothetical protein E4U13_000785 [Claviceps humidiphila]|uniref:Uncharacterized protein n=1 Tax=Claviceps humidiphila TaxID=1294629 RepID=A0A9P7TRN8_9HYPO|nr:hypothetical protein E4U13_000785 [Claviceps humidiphila]